MTSQQFNYTSNFLFICRDGLNTEIKNILKSKLFGEASAKLIFASVDYNNSYEAKYDYIIFNF